MGGIDFVVPVGADQHQVPHIRPGQQILEQIERCRVEPLQIVEEQGERMLLARENTEEGPEDHLEAVLRVLRREVWNGRLLTDDESELGDQVDHELAVWA